MKLLTQYIEHMDQNDALLYGWRGKPLINKQMNYIIDKVCEHLEWIKVEYEQPENYELGSLQHYILSDANYIK